MMNAAAAMSAADSTLRAGRNAALRNPIRIRGTAPWPVMAVRERERSQEERKNIEASNAAPPAPKNAPPAPLGDKPGSDRGDRESREDHRDASDCDVPARVAHGWLLADRLGRQQGRGVCLPTGAQRHTPRRALRRRCRPTRPQAATAATRTTTNSEVPTAPIHHVRRPWTMIWP